MKRDIFLLNDLIVTRKKMLHHLAFVDQNTVKFYGPTENHQQYFCYGSTINMTPTSTSTPEAHLLLTTLDDKNTQPAQQPSTPQKFDNDEFARKH
jgi:hypothetical protein